MNSKPNLLFHCQHSLGMGHLVRSFALAEALARHFNVIFLNGGRLPPAIKPPAGIRLIDLPALGMQTGGALVSQDDRYTVEQAQVIRRQTVLDMFASYSPSVILIELFPFGRKKFADEITPLLERARRSNRHRPLILCSLRDILVRNRDNQQKHDDRACAVLNEYFDGVFIHADPRFARLEETFQPSGRLRVPVYYTGFALPDRPPRAVPVRERRILVSAGGGIVGGALFRTALDAHQELWASDGLPMTIVAGPFLPVNELHELQERAATLPGLELHRSVPDLTRLMRRVCGSISQCGYNTTMDLLHTGVPALVVPFSTGAEDEQTNRAQRLHRLGVVRMLAPEQLSAATLTREIRQLLSFKPKPPNFNMDGARVTVQLIQQSMNRSTVCRSAAPESTGFRGIHL